MFVSKLKVVAAVVLVTVGFGTWAGGLGYRMYAADQPGGKSIQAADLAHAGLAHENLQGWGASCAVCHVPPTDLTPPRLVLRGWGTAIDPDGDCKFTVAKDALTISVPGTDHALCIEQNRMNAPRVLRSVEGDFIAQVKVTSQFPATAKSLVPTRRPFHGAGLLLWQDAKNYVRLEQASVVFDEGATSYVNWELRKGGDFARMGGAGELDLKGASVWLRLERRGDKLYGSVSPDGVQWTTMEPQAVEMPRKLLVGVCAGQNTSTGFEPTFEHYRLLQPVEDK